MKSAFLRSLAHPPRLTRLDLGVTLLGFVLWGAGVFSRPYVIQAHCVQNAPACHTSTVLEFDQPGLGLENSRADALSDVSQNLAGVLALTVPGIWNGSLAAFGRITPATALAWSATDFVLVLQTASWNGVGVELSHLLSQRPRPFVYSNPGKGDLSSNYTSFYSGHTSFTAAASLALVLILISRGAPAPLVVLFAATAQGLTVATAVFRVLAGRHFVSDVLAGAVAGTLVALLVAAFHRPRRSSPVEGPSPIATA